MVRVLDLRLKGGLFEAHLRHFIVSLGLVLVQPRETGNCPNMTEKVLTGTLSINTKQANIAVSLRRFF